MTIEKSHGRARPTLPRASDLPKLEAAPERHGKRDAHGRFAPGNDAGRGRGVKHAIARMLGRLVQDADGVAMAVASDAVRLFNAKVKDLPSDGPVVRSQLALACQHEALNGFWLATAMKAGLATDEGIRAQELAMKHGARAERCMVTCLDLAGKLAAVRPRVPLPWPTAPRAVEAFDDTDDDDDAEPSTGGGDDRAFDREHPPRQGESGRPEGLAGRDRHFSNGTDPSPHRDTASRPMTHGEAPARSRGLQGAASSYALRDTSGDYPTVDRGGEGAGGGSLRGGRAGFGNGTDENGRGFTSRSSRVENASAFASENEGVAEAGGRGGGSGDAFALENKGHRRTETRVSVGVNAEGSAACGAFDPSDKPDGAELARRRAVALAAANAAKGTRVKGSALQPPAEVVRRVERMRRDAERATRKEGGR